MSAVCFRATLHDLMTSPSLAREAIGLGGADPGDAMISRRPISLFGASSVEARHSSPTRPAMPSAAYAFAHSVCPEFALLRHPVHRICTRCVDCLTGS